jgi:hypothetical protein
VKDIFEENLSIDGLGNYQRDYQGYSKIVTRTVKDSAKRLPSMPRRLYHGDQEKVMGYFLVNPSRRLLKELARILSMKLSS